MSGLLQAEDLTVHFPSRGGRSLRSRDVVRAVDGVDLDLAKGETLGLVGESGCGKSTTGLALLRLVEPTCGRVIFDGVDVTALGKRELRRIRRRMAMIFQDPYASLNPRRTVGDAISEPLEIHGLHPGDRQRAARVGELLELVGLRPDYRQRYPHEFSGGQLQRVGIARALASDPDFIVADEPVASLDVSIQAQILNLLQRLKADLDLTMIFIAHDLSTVEHVSDRIAVMYLGRVVESNSSEVLMAEPQHPYTRALLSAVPVPDPHLERERHRILLSGDLPSPAHPPMGCNFHPRCPEAFEPCSRVDPALQELDAGGCAACHLHGVVERDGTAAEVGAQ